MLLVIKKDLVAIDRIVKKIVNSCETEGDEEHSGLRPQGRGNRTSDQCEYKVQIFKILFILNAKLCKVASKAFHHSLHR